MSMRRINYGWDNLPKGLIVMIVEPHPFAGKKAEYVWREQSFIHGEMNNVFETCDTRERFSVFLSENCSLWP